MFRLKPATESLIETRRRDSELTFHADLYKAKHSLNWYKNTDIPLTAENKADLETIRTTINDLIAGKETPSDA